MVKVEAFGRNASVRMHAGAGAAIYVLSTHHSSLQCNCDSRA